MVGSALAALLCQVAAAQTPDAGVLVRPVGDVRHITLRGLETFVETPEAIRIRHETWLVGNFGMAWRMSADTLTEFLKFAGLMLDSSLTAREIPLPSGFEELLAPALVRVANGVGVFWGATSDTASRHAVRQFFWSVWNGTSWSPPEAIRASDDVWWQPRSRSNIVARHDTLFLAAPGDYHRSGVSLFRRTNGRWTERRIPTAGTGYVELTSTAGELVMLGVGKVGERNSVYAVVSPDGGDTWGPPVLLDTLDGGQNAFDPALHVGPDGTVFAMWSHSPIMSPTANAVSAAERSPDGVWSVMPRRGFPFEFWGLWTSGAPRGLHAIHPAATDALEYTGWLDGSWRVSPLSGTDGAMPNPTWEPSGDCTLALFWGVFTNRYFMPSLRYRRYAVSCR